MKSVFFVAVSLFATLAFADNRQFPIEPDTALTPGDLCDDPDSLRYPERIKYCERDVSGGRKAEVFRRYDQIGFRTRSMNRQSFKIDHYIPLCAGGSNDIENLWPQHSSVYKYTDELEALVCEKMKEGRLTQKRAVEYIIEAKHNLEKASYIISVVEAL